MFSEQKYLYQVQNKQTNKKEMNVQKAFSSSATNFFFLNLAPLRKILLIWLVYNYLTISANCSWKVFSVCDFCHSLDCFGKWHFSYADSKNVSFSASLFFVTNSTWPSSNLLSSVEAECKAKLKKKTTAELWKYIVFSDFSASFCAFAITANC